MIRLCLIVMTLIAVAGNAAAAPTLSMKAQLFHEEAGKWDDDLFASGKTPTPSQIDQQPYADDLLIIITVAGGEQEGAELVVKQGKKVTKRKLGPSAQSPDKWSMPTLVHFSPCEKLELTLTVGKTKLVKKIDFTCGE